MNKLLMFYKAASNSNSKGGQKTVITIKKQNLRTETFKSVAWDHS